jgi:hypothetical protein
MVHCLLLRLHVAEQGWFALSFRPLSVLSSHPLKRHGMQLQYSKAPTQDAHGACSSHAPASAAQRTRCLQERGVPAHQLPHLWRDVTLPDLRDIQSVVRMGDKTNQ